LSRSIESRACRQNVSSDPTRGLASHHGASWLSLSEQD
jgi:hypothetical protein